MGAIGIFGGTFDPIHFGHLRTALELRERIGLSEVRFVPCADPPHRATTPVGGVSRLDLVGAAIADQPGFLLDDREFGRSGPSYSVDTLASLREEHPESSLSLLMGMDSFVGLTEWHEWERLTELAHIVVAHRPGWRAPEEGALGKLLSDCGTDNAQRLHDVVCGHVFIMPVTQLEISATDLRASLRAGVDARYLVPESVRQIIIESGCYAETGG